MPRYTHAGHAVRILLLLLSLYIPAQSNCQRYTLNRPALWVGMGAAFTSGAAWGLHEKSTHHWHEFHARFPKVDPRIWGPDAWRNKYVNGDPALGRVKWDFGPVRVVKPVHFTDAAHPLATITQAGLLTAGVCITIGEQRPWWHYTADLLLVSLARSGGNYLTFNLLYKQ